MIYYETGDSTAFPESLWATSNTSKWMYSSMHSGHLMEARVQLQALAALPAVKQLAKQHANENHRYVESMIGKIMGGKRLLYIYTSFPSLIIRIQNT